MDELTQVRDLFAEPPPPSAPVTARAWRLLDQRMQGEVRPLRRGHRGHPGRRGRRRLGPVAAAVAAACAVAAITITAALAPAGMPGGLNGALVGRPAGAFLLAMSAKAAHGQPAGRYWCTVSVAGSRELIGAGDKEISPAWLDGTAHIPAAAPAGYRYAILSRSRLLECIENQVPGRAGWPGGTIGGSYQALGIRPASPADFAAWRRDGSPDHWRAWYTNRTDSARPGPRSWNAKIFPGDDASARTYWPRVSLPASPAKLKALLLSLIRRPANRPAYLFGWTIGGTSDQTLLLFTTAMGLATNSPVTPAVRAAAYQVVAGIKGVQMKAGIRDPEGGVGTAVWLGQPGRVPADVQLIDPATSNYLGHFQVAPTQEEGAPPGTILTYTAVISSYWTNRLPVPASFIAPLMRQAGIRTW